MFEFFIENKLISSVSLVLSQAIPASIKCYLLLTRYTVLLVKAFKLEVYSSIWQRHLIRSGVIVYSNSTSESVKVRRPYKNVV